MIRWPLHDFQVTFLEAIILWTVWPQPNNSSWLTITSCLTNQSLHSSRAPAWHVTGLTRVESGTTRTRTSLFGSMRRTTRVSFPWRKEETCAQCLIAFVAGSMKWKDLSSAEDTSICGINTWVISSRVHPILEPVLGLEYTSNYPTLPRQECCLSC